MSDIDTRAEQLRELIEEHGADAVGRVTGLKPRTVLEYAGRSARCMPWGHLVKAQRELKSTSWEAKEDA